MLRGLCQFPDNTEKGVTVLRVPEHEQRRHKLTINLTDAEHDVLMAEAEARQLVPSVVARECFAQGLRRFTQQAEEPAPAVKPADRIPQPRTRQPGTRTPAAVIKQRQAEQQQAEQRKPEQR